MTASLPVWAAVAVAVGTPVLAFAGALIGQVLARRGAREEEVRWRREETMRLLRWAAELAADDDVSRSAVGVAALEALERSDLLRADDQAIVSTVLDAVVDLPASAYAEGDVVEEVE